MGIEHATFAPVDVYTKPDPVIELMPAPVIVPSFVQIHEAVTDSENPKFSITDDKTSQVSVERIQEQSAVSDLVTSVESSPVPLLHAVEYVLPEPRVIVQRIPSAQVGERIQEQIAETISQETVQQRTDEQIMAVAAPCAATASPAPPMSMIGHAMLTPVDVYTKTAAVIEPMAAPVIEYIAPSPAVSYPSAFSSDIPRVQVVKRIRGKRAHQRTVEQTVRAPVPMQEQSFVPEKPGAQGEADLKTSELEEEEAHWNEYVYQMGPEQMHQDWLLDQMAEQMHQERKP